MRRPPGTALRSVQGRCGGWCQGGGASVVADLFFAGNFETARHTLQEQGYIPHMLSKSRFNRRVHRLQGWVMILFNLLGLYWKEHNPTARYILDSYPLAACDNYPILRAKRYQGAVWRGDQASKRRYFYGLKLHVMVTETGQPVEFFLTPGSLIECLLPKSIHSVRPQGFELKVALFVLACSLNFLW